MFGDSSIYKAPACHDERAFTFMKKYLVALCYCLIFSIKKRKPFLRFPFSFAERETPLAEGEGFKPPIPEKGIPDFESSAIDHSANLPFQKWLQS